MVEDTIKYIGKRRIKLEIIKIPNYGPNNKKENSHHIEYKVKTVSVQETTNIDKHNGKFNQLYSFGKEKAEIEIERYIEEFIIR